ncbi:ubiquitin carboxyl-terminal hydrolase 21-like [Urocitellus parryii]
MTKESSCLQGGQEYVRCEDSLTNDSSASQRSIPSTAQLNRSCQQHLQENRRSTLAHCRKPTLITRSSSVGEEGRPRWSSRAPQEFLHQYLHLDQCMSHGPQSARSDSFSQNSRTSFQMRSDMASQKLAQGSGPCVSGICGHGQDLCVQSKPRRPSLDFRCLSGSLSQHLTSNSHTTGIPTRPERHREDSSCRTALRITPLSAFQILKKSMMEGRHSTMAAAAPGNRVMATPCQSHHTSQAETPRQSCPSHDPVVRKKDRSLSLAATRPRHRDFPAVDSSLLPQATFPEAHKHSPRGMERAGPSAESRSLGASIHQPAGVDVGHRNPAASEDDSLPRSTGPFTLQAMQRTGPTDEWLKQLELGWGQTWGPHPLQADHGVPLPGSPPPTVILPIPFWTNLAHSASAHHTLLLGSGHVGLQNLGNTCFLNAVLQCLSSTRPLRDFCLQRNFRPEVPGRGQDQELTEAFADVMGALWHPNSCEAVDPTEFQAVFQKYVPSFSGNNQQDAHEFLRLLMERLHLELHRPGCRAPPILANDPAPSPSLRGETLLKGPELSDDDRADLMWKHYLEREGSQMVDLFAGQLRSCRMCQACGSHSMTFEVFFDLSLPIPQDRFSGEKVSLWDCFHLFTKEEEIELENAPVCDPCGQKTQSTKKLTIQRFPSILVLHLNRFSSSQGTINKISLDVDFPLQQMSLEDFTSDRTVSPVYELYALCNHSGSVHSGHYTALCRSQTGWHVYDDSCVSPISESQVASSEGYVLFYQLMQGPSQCWDSPPNSADLDLCDSIPSQPFSQSPGAM